MKYLFYISIFLTIKLNGQSLINAGGNSSTNYYYSIGETVIFDKTQVGLGFLQEAFINGQDVLKYRNEEIDTNFYLENLVVIMPNPTKDYVIVQFPNSLQELVISLYSPLGFQLSNYTSSSNHTKIDLNSFSCGVYTLKLECKDFIKTVKIVKE